MKHVVVGPPPKVCIFTIDAVFILKYFQFVNFSIKRLLVRTLFNKEWEIVVEIYCVIIFIVNVMILQVETRSGRHHRGRYDYIFITCQDCVNCHRLTASHIDCVYSLSHEHSTWFFQIQFYEAI